MSVSYRAAAEALWGEAGLLAHDAYDRVRRDVFDGDLPGQIPIVIGITAYGHCDGLTRSGWSHGPRISLSSSAFGRGQRWVVDLVTHEMLHVWLGLSELQTKHAGADWYEHVRRLSPAVLGHEVDARRGAGRRSVRVPNPDWEEGGDLPKTVVRKERVDGVIQHADVARWPHAFRPENYYSHDAPVGCPTY